MLLQGKAADNDDLYDSDDEDHHDAYMERMKAEGKQREEDDDDDSDSDGQISCHDCVFFKSGGGGGIFLFYENNK